MGDDTREKMWDQSEGLEEVANTARHRSPRVEVGTALFVLHRAPSSPGVVLVARALIPMRTWISGIHQTTIKTLLVVVCLQLGSDGVQLDSALCTLRFLFRPNQDC